MRGARRVLAVVVALVATVLAGCTVPRPPGDGTIRYRDQVFPSVTRTNGLVYGRAPDGNGNPVDLALDLYQPTGDTANGRPAVVLIHGGGFSGGVRTSAEIVDLANEFAKRGYVAVSISYRLLATSGCGGSGTPSNQCFIAALEAQHDAQAAVRWLRRNASTYRIDPERIVMGGSSAGAVTSLLVGSHSEDPGTSGNPGFPSTVRGVMSLSGGVPGNAFISAGDAPALFFHSGGDAVVPFSWATGNVTAYVNAGVPVVIEPWNGTGHVPYGQFRNQIVTQTAYFFYYALGYASPPS